MTNTTSAQQPADPTTEFDRWLEANTDTDASRKALSRNPWYITALLRIIYLSGVLGLGYVTATWAMNEVGMHPVPAIGLTAIIETFVLVAFHYSVRARLRGLSSWHLRAVGYLGVAASAGIQIAWHYDDKPGVPVLVTVAGILSAISWTLDQSDKHAAVFRKQDGQRRAKRAQRWAALRSNVAYAFSVTPWALVRGWQRRTANVGTIARNVDETLAVRSHEARANVVNGELMPVSPAAPVGPFVPPVIAGRPVSTPPASSVIGDDLHADHMRTLTSATACARYALELHGPDVRPIDVRNWLAGYGVHLADSSLRGLRLQMYPTRKVITNVAALGNMRPAFDEVDNTDV